ncbi:MAG: PstS family phosphate ABC transporter substrate-binding protein [Proteobacteria bacterium]|jgi:phosphate transport system substrate-binding protein|nr:PstS family phosphate ABC transporter substrate-binding protein [Pseudomonadota bacterium]
MKRTVLLLALTLMVWAIQPASAASRDYITIVGSSTLYPFSTVVAEQFGRATRFKTPKIESTGSGGGMKLFCAGVGVEHPDITNSSRRIKKSELDSCHSNGVFHVVEVKVGYDGIAIANSKESTHMSLTRKDIFLALAKHVPKPDGSQTLVLNPHETWQDVNPTLPDLKIEVLGPPPTSGTRDAFVELAMEAGCEQIDWIKAMDDRDRKATCRTMREDGAYVEAGENDNLIVQKLESNPNALGIFGFSFLDQNADKVQGSLVDGVAPEFEEIASGAYPVSRSLYFYVKGAHVGSVPGIAEFLAEWAREGTWGDEGYLTDKGLIPMPAGERDEFAAAIRNLTNLKL